MRRPELPIAATILLLTGSCLAAPIDINGPTFDCGPGAKSPLAKVLCTDPKAAQADWDLNASSWAYYASNPVKGDKEWEKWGKSLSERCRLPRPLSQDEQVGRAMAGQIGRMVLGTDFRIPGQQRKIGRAHV